MDAIISHILPLLGAGLVSGFLAGLLGIGGGVVTIPVLFVVFGELGIPDQWRMHIAIATSLTIIIATNMSSAWAHHKKGGVDGAIVRDWWWAIALGAICGSFFAKGLKTAELVYFFAVLATFLAIKMLLPVDRFKLGESLPKGLFRYLNPALIGFLAAIMGIGGGNLMVPYMTLYRIPIHRAVGTASLTGLIVSIAAGLGYLVGGWGIEGLPVGMAGFIHLPSAVVVAFAAVLTAPIGARVAHALPRNVLSIVFGLFLVAATIRLLSAV